MAIKIFKLFLQKRLNFSNRKFKVIYLLYPPTFFKSNFTLAPFPLAPDGLRLWESAASAAFIEKSSISPPPPLPPTTTPPPLLNIGEKSSPALSVWSSYSRSSAQLLESISSISFAFSSIVNSSGTSPLFIMWQMSSSIASSKIWVSFTKNTTFLFSEPTCWIIFLTWSRQSSPYYRVVKSIPNINAARRASELLPEPPSPSNRACP